jgi:ABC-2 type transport system permease protein
MRNIWLIARREFASFLRTPGGYVIASVVLLIDGLLFNSYAMGEGSKLSTAVLQDFFYFASGTTMIAAVLLSMRLLAEEKQSGTMVLLFTSPVRESHIVLAKFLSAFLFLSLLTLLTAYLPALIFVNGKVAVAHIVVGYLGLLLLGAACLSLGLFASALSRSQVVAAVLGGVFVVTFLISWLLARITDPPLKSVVSYLALFNEHFQPFMRGMLRLSDVVFYVSIVYIALLASTRVIQSQRWQ